MCGGSAWQKTHKRDCHAQCMTLESPEQATVLTRKKSVLCSPIKSSKTSCAIAYHSVKQTSYSYFANWMASVTKLGVACCAVALNYTYCLAMFSDIVKRRKLLLVTNWNVSHQEPLDMIISPLCHQFSAWIMATNIKEVRLDRMWQGAEGPAVFGPPREIPLAQWLWMAGHDLLPRSLFKAASGSLHFGTQICKLQLWALYDLLGFSVQTAIIFIYILYWQQVTDKTITNLTGWSHMLIKRIPLCDTLCHKPCLE